MARRASQSAGRALVGYLSPDSRRAEFFGLWGLAVKLSSILGPVTYGLVNWLSGGDHRLAMLVTGGFFLAGLGILRGINPERGRAAARLADAPVPPTVQDVPDLLRLRVNPLKMRLELQRLDARLRAARAQL